MLHIHNAVCTDITEFALPKVQIYLQSFNAISEMAVHLYSQGIK